RCTMTQESDISRRAVLGLAAGVAVTAAVGSSAAAAPDRPLPPGRGVGREGRDLSTSLLQQWTRRPASHPLVGDFTGAGYRQGAPTPRPPVTVNVTRFGAVGDG